LNKPTKPKLTIREFNNGFMLDEAQEIETNRFLNYIQCEFTGTWFEPPINLQMLANTFNASSYHSSAIYVKRNILSRAFIPNNILSRNDFSRLALDLLVLGNCYLEKNQNKDHKPTLKAILAKYMRVDEDRNYYFIQNDLTPFKFKKNTICHIFAPDINQEIYGVPEYIASINATWLDKAATVFRRRYYLNGSHAGYILYLSNPTHNEADIKALEEALKNSRGPGNFHNLVVYAPNGKADGLKLIPVGEVAAKDNFEGIKETSREDILAAHRVPPVLMGITPKNTGGFGDPEKALKVFFLNEIFPLMEQFKVVNDFLGVNAIEFKQDLFDVVQ